ncbi:hypothetical protein BpHYR1_048844 [Brachionus plicatilis]|uniref:Uncharacterized protein n=1 Tax=Brachionus plicatilis TaxID=10195 RepID=A0A3M7SU18_BRAPC|nr:hypothetical protein BpHYR1_048844 [Brachionus plicatilis]
MSVLKFNNSFYSKVANKNTLFQRKSQNCSNYAILVGKDFVGMIKNFCLKLKLYIISISKMICLLNLLNCGEILIK